MTRHQTMRRTAAVTGRVLVAVLGGYAFSAAASAALALTLSRVAGMPRSEAVLLAAMLGFLVYLVVLLWAFAQPRLRRVTVVLLGGALVGYGVVRLLSAAPGSSLARLFAGGN